MPTIDVQTETEEPSRWRYRVTLTEGEMVHAFDVTLSWADYDLWCHGRVAPEKVVKAAFAFLLDHEPIGSIMRRFDCSVIRRYFPQVDEELPRRL